jgi:hypothetical protein
MDAVAATAADAPVRYQISTLTSGDAAAFCVVPACCIVTPLYVGAPPARLVALNTHSLSTRHVTPLSGVNVAVVIVVEALFARVLLLPRVWAIRSAGAERRT